MVGSAGIIRLRGNPSERFLNAGEVVKGKITQVDKNNVAVISIKGRKLAAELPYRMQPGREVLLEVRSIHPRPVFDVVDADALVSLAPPGKIASRFGFELTSFMDKIIPLLTSLGKSDSYSVKMFLAGIFPLFYRGGDPVSLKRLLRQYRVEKDFAETIKKRIGEALSRLSSSVKDAHPEGFLKLLELLPRSLEHGVYPIPFLFDGEMGVACLQYERKKRGEGGTEIHLFSLALEMTKLGRVESSLNLTDNRVNVIFKVDREESLSHIRGNILLLKEMLEASGFNLSGADVVLKEVSSHSSRHGKGDDVKSVPEEYSELDLLA